MTDDTQEITEAIDRVHRACWSIGSSVFHDNRAQVRYWLALPRRTEGVVV